MKTRVLITVLMITILLFSLSSCFPLETRPPGAPAPSGFFMGVWHGWIAPISVIVGFFDRNVRIYDPFNTGWWYDLGFYIAIVGGFGGISFVRNKSKKE